MKSDVIHTASDGTGIVEALKQAEAVAVYKALSGKDAIHLRLLAEEMTGMIKALTGELAAEFWIETVGDRFELHLRTDTEMNPDKRQRLLAVTTSGKNSASGFMGKVRSAFEAAVSAMERGYADSVGAGLIDPNGNIGFADWTLTKYRQNAKGEEWDELERSIVAKIADEVKVCIKGSSVEMIIEKRF